MEAYTVIEASKQLNTTRQTIYNKLKYKDVKEFVKKIKGVTYIEKQGLELIAEKIECKTILQDDVNQNISSSPNDTDTNVNTCKKEFDVFLQNEYLDSLKSEIEHLRKELTIKNEQLQKKDFLMENMQILLKQSQDKVLMLESSKEKQSFWKRLFM